LLVSVSGQSLDGPHLVISLRLLGKQMDMNTCYVATCLSAHAIGQTATHCTVDECLTRPLILKTVFSFTIRPSTTDGGLSYLPGLPVSASNDSDQCLCESNKSLTNVPFILNRYSAVPFSAHLKIRLLPKSRDCSTNMVKRKSTSLYFLFSSVYDEKQAVPNAKDESNCEKVSLEMIDCGDVIEVKMTVRAIADTNVKFEKQFQGFGRYLICLLKG
jgi:hypothetical protein